MSGCHLPAYLQLLRSLPLSRIAAVVPLKVLARLSGASACDSVVFRICLNKQPLGLRGRPCTPLHTPL